MNKRSKNRKDTNSPANRGQNVRTPRSIQSGGRSDFESRSSDEDDDIREKSIKQWLDQMSGHEDIEVRGGTKVTQGYIEDLKRKISSLEEKNAVKDRYLKKMKLARKE